MQGSCRGGGANEPKSEKRKEGGRGSRAQRGTVSAGLLLLFPFSLFSFFPLPFSLFLFLSSSCASPLSKLFSHASALRARIPFVGLWFVGTQISACLSCLSPPLPSTRLQVISYYPISLHVARLVSFQLNEFAIDYHDQICQ